MREMCDAWCVHAWPSIRPANVILLSAGEIRAVVQAAIQFDGAWCIAMRGHSLLVREFATTFSRGVVCDTTARCDGQDGAVRDRESPRAAEA